MYGIFSSSFIQIFIVYLFIYSYTLPTLKFYRDNNKYISISRYLLLCELNKNERQLLPQVLNNFSNIPKIMIWNPAVFIHA